MAQTSWPFENIDTTETQFSQWARNINEGVRRDAGDELEVTAAGTGMTVDVGSGQAMIRGHYYSSTSSESLAITAADPADPRIDAVVLELDPTANTVLLKVLPGTPDAAPVAPTLTQTDSGVYQIRLANIQVDAATLAIESGDITDTRDIMKTTQELTPLAVAVETKTANYTLNVGDSGDLVQVNGTYTVTVPASTFQTGTRVDVVNIGTGVVTFAAGAGLTLNSKEAALTIDTQWAAASVFFTSATTAILVGDLA
jgi:hypothetical protein